MAETVANALIEEIISKLISMVANEIGLAWGFKRQLRKLQNTLVGIQNVLEEAETRQVMEKNVKKWLMSLKDVAYEADDILDENTTEILRRKFELGSRIKKVCNFFSPFSNPIVFRLKMAHKIRNINVKLDEIDKEKNRFQFSSTDTTNNQKRKEGRETYSFLDHADSPAASIVGRDEDTSKIIKNLKDYCDEALLVLPIVGMGGIGKTTLAQLVFNDESMNQHFDLKMWVCVSDDFDVKRLARQIIESVTKNSCSIDNWDTIVGKIRDTLRGKRYLLVLDDVWNEDEREWNRLRNCLVGEGAREGSRILVTTRSEKVASMMGGEPLMHHLKGLRDEDCWSIFERRAFGGRVDVIDKNPDLVKIGKELVKKCKGVPLAAKALGGLMRTKSEKKKWESVRDSEIWKQYENDETEIMAALKLSYDHLPYHLKQCFAYCSVFPKDYWIHKERLIRHWVAHGYVVECSDQQVKVLEDTAEDYLNSLLWRSFFQDAERDDLGNIWRFKMHDLMHDLAQLVNGNECGVLKLSSDSVDDQQLVDQRFVHEKTRHLSVVPSKTPKVILEMLSLYSGGGRRRLRSIDLMNDFPYYIDFDHKVFDYISSNFKCLRVLDLRDAKIREVSLWIGRLKHLRYLDLSGTSIQELPNSITNLYSLQTLMLVACGNLRQLPRDMRKMINLRHLNIMGTDIHEMPQDMRQLTNLQTLLDFVVGKDYSLRAGLGELGPLNHLRRLEEARRAMLKEKHNLLTMGLDWREDFDVLGDALLQPASPSLEFEVVNDVLEALQPHSNLEVFSIQRFPGTRLPSWITMIERVIIWECPNLISLQGGNQDSSSVSLKQLNINRCSNLTSLWEEIQGFTSLKELKIVGCPNLTRRYNKETGEDWNKIAHIPNVHIDMD
uniref:Disease resistance protein RGA3 n=1 Tax=Nelumbo nucifera TaxID=4432 RepID=A0A822ZYF8_NELNU|nr:TPA_asm: hypothetical protein HUJ06_018498 [Nelumbo nucifera]